MGHCIEQLMGRMYSVNEYIVARIAAKIRLGRAERAGELLEAAERERELSVDVERGGREAAMGEWELSREGKLEAELGLTATALGNKLRNGVAGNAAGEAAIEDRTAQRAFLGGERAAEEIFWCHRHCLEFVMEQ